MQDGFKVRPNLYLSLGLRYDYDLQPSGTPRDGNNFGPRFGFAYDPEASAQSAGPLRASGLAVEEMWTVTTSTVSHIAQIFVPEKRKELGSVVGGYNETRKAIELDTTAALMILAFISLSLGVINLFPFLPLDGGHIFWALAEKVRGRAIPFSVMERAGFIGFALVIGLFVIGIFAAIGRYLVEETDEYIRFLTVRQTLIACGLALSFATAWGFLESFGLAPHFDTYWIAVIWFAGLGLGACINKLLGRRLENEV